MGLPLAIGLHFWCVIPGPWSYIHIQFSVFYRFIAHTAAIAVLAAALFLTNFELMLEKLWLELYHCRLKEQPGCCNKIVECQGSTRSTSQESSDNHSPF